MAQVLHQKLHPVFFANPINNPFLFAAVSGTIKRQYQLLHKQQKEIIIKKISHCACNLSHILSEHV